MFSNLPRYSRSRWDDPWVMSKCLGATHPKKPVTSMVRKGLPVVHRWMLIVHIMGSWASVSFLGIAVTTPSFSHMFTVESYHWMIFPVLNHHCPIISPWYYHCNHYIIARFPIQFWKYSHHVLIIPNDILVQRPITLPIILTYNYPIV